MYRQRSVAYVCSSSELCRPIAISPSQAGSSRLLPSSAALYSFAASTKKPLIVFRFSAGVLAT